MLINWVPWLQSKLLFQQNCRFSFLLKLPAWRLANFSTVIDFLSGIQTCYLSLRLSLRPVVWSFQVLKGHLGSLDQSFLSRDAHIWGIFEGSRCAQAHPRLNESQPGGKAGSLYISKVPQAILICTSALDPLHWREICCIYNSPQQIPFLNKINKLYIHTRTATEPDEARLSLPYMAQGYMEKKKRQGIMG